MTVALRPERDLRNCPVFSSPDVDMWTNRHNMPWPTPGESLLSDSVGSENFIFPYEEWIPSELERLGFFAMLFEERARDLVRKWVRSHEKPENFVYAVGFLYRHAIELYLKDIVASSAWFRALTLKDQRDAIDGHRLSKLWAKTKALIVDYTNDAEMQTLEKQLLELDQLDTGSDGFRYPFGFADKVGNRKPLLAGIAYASFDNFVWVLDGLCSWLSASGDMKEQYEQYLAELRAGGGP